MQNTKAINFLVLLFFFMIIVAQDFFSNNLGLDIFRAVDKIVILGIILIMIAYAARTHKIKKFFAILLLNMILLIGLSVILGINSFEQNIIGYFDIYRNAFIFLGIPILIKLLKVNKKTINILLQVVIYSMIIYTVLYYIFPNSFLNYKHHIRMGVPRLSNIIADINNFAFALLVIFFAVYFDIIEIKRKKIIMYLIILMLVLTFSRSTLFLLIIILFIVNIKKKEFLIRYIPIVIILFTATKLYDNYVVRTNEVASREFRINPFVGMPTSTEFSEGEYRYVVYFKSIQMFMENPIFGTGLGTFGTPISLKKESYLYKKYNFPQTKYVKGGFNIQDAYYPIIYVQTGIIGTIIFFIIWYKIIVVNRKYTKSRKMSLIIYFSLCMLAFNSMTFMVGNIMFLFAVILNYSILKDKEKEVKMRLEKES